MLNIVQCGCTNHSIFEYSIIPTKCVCLCVSVCVILE